MELTDVIGGMWICGEGRSVLFIGEVWIINNFFIDLFDKSDIIV